MKRSSIFDSVIKRHVVHKKTLPTPPLQIIKVMKLKGLSSFLKKAVPPFMHRLVTKKLPEGSRHHKKVLLLTSSVADTRCDL